MPSLRDRVAAEFAGARLGNRLRVLRAQSTAGQLVTTAGHSLPRTLSPSALQGTYRLLRTPAVLPEALLEPHQNATVQRMGAHDDVLGLHDTTEARFGGRVLRRGLGALAEGGQGFFAHFALAVTTEGRPLGALHLYAWHRPTTAVGAKVPKKKKIAPNVRNFLEDKESLRWLEGVEAVEARVKDTARLVHVMDREGDAFELLAALLDRGSRFVIRACHDRRLNVGRSRVAAKVDKLFATLASRSVVCEREVEFGPRGAHARQSKRTARVTTLEVRGGSFVLSPAMGAVTHVPQRMPVNVVEVRERTPPEGEEPIVWRLLTTEPVQTEQDLLRVVDWYRRRWMIEEFFKVLKTGCSYESLQLCTGHALLNALALLIPVAWTLLDLRWMERAEPNANAEAILTETQVELLRRTRPKPGKRADDVLTIRQALLAIAALGGHLAHNGAPGWQTLLHGYRELLTLERGSLLMAPREPPKPDQS